MMKRILATLMAMVLCLSLVAGAMAEELTVESLGVEFLVPDGDMIPDIPDEYDGHKTMSVPAFAATLTPEELQQVHDGNYTAVFCTFDAQSAWGRAMVNAVTNTLAALNIELLAATDGAQKVETCVKNFESAIQLNPDVIIVAGMDPAAEYQGWKNAIDEGRKLVFIQNVPSDFVVNQDYYGCVCPDNYSQAYIGHKQMLEAIGGEGEVVYINIVYDNYENKLRQQAFADACAEYPNVTVLDTVDVMSIEEANNFAESMAQTHPDLKGVAGLWDELVMAAINAMNGLGMDVKGGTNGISELSCLSMIQGTGYVGSGTECAKDMGCGAVLMAAAALLGKECPEMMLTPTVKCNKDNLPEAWKLTYGEDLPANLQKAWDAANN